MGFEVWDLGSLVVGVGRCVVCVSLVCPVSLGCEFGYVATYPLGYGDSCAPTHAVRYVAFLFVLDGLLQAQPLGYTSSLT